MRRMGKKALIGMLVGAILMLVAAVIVGFSVNQMMSAGEEAPQSAVCTASLNMNAGNLLWVLRGQVFDKDKNEVFLKGCKTWERTLDSGDDKTVSGELAVLMENCYNQYKRHTGVFYMPKGSVCIACYNAEIQGLPLLQSLPGILVNTSFSGFEPRHYVNFNTKNHAMVMFVFADESAGFMEGFSLKDGSGVFLWDSTKLNDLPCAVLEGDPLKVRKEYGVES